MQDKGYTHDYSINWSGHGWYLWRVTTFTDGRDFKTYEFRQYDNDGITRSIGTISLSHAITLLKE